MTNTNRKIKKIKLGDETYEIDVENTLKVYHTDNKSLAELCSITSEELCYLNYSDRFGNFNLLFSCGYNGGPYRFYVMDLATLKFSSGFTYEYNLDGNATLQDLVDLIKYPEELSTDTNTTYDLSAAKSKSNGSVTLDLTAGGSGSGTDSVTIKGTGATTVTTDANGVITINSTDNNTDTNTSHSHSAGVGLVGSGSAGTSGGTYNYKVALVNETKASNASSYTAGAASKFYSVQLDKDGKLAVNVPWTDTDTNTHNSHKINSGKKSDNSTDIISAAASSGDITLGDSGVAAGTYKRVTVNSKGIVVGGDNTDADTHYTKYLQIKGNGTEAVKFTQDADKTLNLKPGANVSISAASGEITISATDTNTWRGIQDNLTSTSTTDSLSAKQGKELKALIDGKANASHGTHVTADSISSVINNNGSTFANIINPEIVDLTEI